MNGAGLVALCAGARRHVAGQWNPMNEPERPTFEGGRKSKFWRENKYVVVGVELTSWSY
jgi:hypothetical protein